MIGNRLWLKAHALPTARLDAAMALDEKGRCCGRKPLVYKRDPHLFCTRCDRAFDPDTGKQIGNWAWMFDGVVYVAKYPTKATS
jgi:hypothetical protein